MPDEWLVREHRGGLADSMATVQAVRDMAHLVVIIARTLVPDGVAVRWEQVHVEPYVYDDRIGWNTHLITIDGHGVWGMANGPIPGMPESASPKTGGDG